MNRFAEVKDLIMSLEGDFDKFYDKGNQAAGTRVRGGMQQLNTLKTRGKKITLTNKTRSKKVLYSVFSRS